MDTFVVVLSSTLDLSSQLRIVFAREFFFPHFYSQFNYQTKRNLCFKKFSEIEFLFSIVNARGVKTLFNLPK